MKTSTLASAVSVTLLVASIIICSAHAAPKNNPQSTFEWSTVVNNNDMMPGAPGNRTFNSYNQPSVNEDGLVVFRARSRGGTGQGQPTHGIYTRDMLAGGPVLRILDRSTLVPDPNNLGTKFVETPSFPRIDMESDTIATRGNHQPVWNYVIDTDPETGENIETRAGTTGIYTNPFGELITGASKLGAVDDFSFFEVPEPEFPGTPFDVFPGSPAVTNGNTIVFKGNYTVDQVGKTGVYFRDLDDAAAGASSPVVLIANNTDTKIPGTDMVFGSTAPPSAAHGQIVFAGFDNEEAPTLGGIYLAPLQSEPPLTTLVNIGQQVPGEDAGQTFNGLGEGVAFDGRFVGFWGAWGDQTRTVRLYCPTEGNKDRIAYCKEISNCDASGRCYQKKEVPVNQGVFAHDIKTGKTWVVAKTGAQFDDFLFWNFSGMTPGTSGGHSAEGTEDDGEPARWRSSAFVAVSSLGATFKAAFKARSANFEPEPNGGVYSNVVDGIYLGQWPGHANSVEIETVVDSTMEGKILDPDDAPVDSFITELGIEREGLRGKWLTINASMGIENGTEEDGMAGIYLTELP